MPANADLLYGKIALSRGFCTAEQIEKCVELQAAESGNIPLGQILLREGYLGPDDHVEVIDTQRRNFGKANEEGETKEEALLGRMAIRDGLLTQEQLNVGLRLQAKEQDDRTLGEILIEAGFLKVTQVITLLAGQQKKVMNCPECVLSFTVTTITKSTAIKCPKCKEPLKEGKPDGTMGTDAEFATMEFRAVESNLKVEPKKKPVLEAVPVRGRRIQIICRICKKSFRAAPDSTGRVTCTHCRITFVHKRGRS